MTTLTADEWTADTVIEMGGTTDWQVGNEIATAHNAALAAERGRLNATFKDMASQIDQLRKDRAAAVEALEYFAKDSTYARSALAKLEGK